MAKQTGPVPALPIERILAAEKKSGVSPARKAFNKLLKSGVDEERLLVDLCNIFLNLTSKRGPYLRGKEDKAAKRFPGRIEKCADEMESVNTGTLFYELLLSQLVNAKTGHKEPWLLDADYRKTLEVFQGLPSLLRAYAKFVEFAIQKKKRRPWVTADLVIDLIAHVRATGKPHYAEIEALLDAVFREQGETSPYDRRKLEDLWRKTRPILHRWFCHQAT
jgi:hypothetical protein